MHYPPKLILFPEIIDRNIKYDITPWDPPGSQFVYFLTIEILEMGPEISCHIYVIIFSDLQNMDFFF